jgi:hypothetical protein
MRSRATKPQADRRPRAAQARLAIAATAVLAAAVWAAVGGAATKSSTTTVEPQSLGSAEMKCPKGQRVVAANVHGDAAESGPRVVVNTLVRPSKRKLTTEAYNFGDTGELTAIGRCEKRPRSKPVSESTTLEQYEEGSVTASCPKGKRIVFGGFHGEREDAFSAPGVFVTAARRTGARGWTVEGSNAGDLAGELEALAYCGKTGKTKARTETIGLGQFELGSAEASCPRGTHVRYGGFEKVAGTPGRVELHAMERKGGRRLRVTASEGSYLSPGDEMGLTAIAYCR